MRLDAGNQSLNCEFCGTVRIPNPNRDGVRVGPAVTESCSFCDVPLHEAELGQQFVLYCDRCGGVLVAMSSFPPLIAALREGCETSATVPRPIDWDALRRTVQCPKCSAAMNTHPYGGPGAIVIDTCEHCMVNWLDRGEISRVATAPDTSRWTPPPAD